MLFAVMEREWFRLAHESNELDIAAAEIVKKRILMSGEEC